MSKQATISDVRKFLELVELAHGDLPIFYNDDCLDEWQLTGEKLVVSPEKRTPGLQGDNYYPKRVTVKIFT